VNGHLAETADVHIALMTATSGGIWNDIVWLCIADIQQMGGNSRKAPNHMR